jgi:hypothetical protein
MGTFLKEESDYTKHFKEMLKKEGVPSPADLSDERKKDFFTKVDNSWNSKEESGKDGKKE